jgi:epoxyqueuosine reductase
MAKRGSDYHERESIDSESDVSTDALPVFIELDPVTVPTGFTLGGSELTRAVRTAAYGLGFHLVGFTHASEAHGFPQLREWIARGYAGEMDYFERRSSAYAHPKHVLAEVSSLVMLGFPYRTQAPAKELPKGSGRIARYAWGRADYHDLIHDRLSDLAAMVQQYAPQAIVRGVVDTAPLLEREFAQRAGLGWIGKNTLLLNKYAGSYFFLACLLTDQEFELDPPHVAEHCGTCRACLEACPTQAFPKPGVLDATRCLSYLTIEHRGPIAQSWRTSFDEWLFGCDVCQEVCPWNRRGSQSTLPALASAEPAGIVDLLELLALDETAFRRRFRGTPLFRSKRRGVLRNALLILGNQRYAPAEPAMERLLHDHEPLLRGAAAWALGKLGTPTSLTKLQDRLKIESDASVAEEIAAVLGQISPTEPP